MVKRFLVLVVIGMVVFLIACQGSEETGVDSSSDPITDSENADESSEGDLTKYEPEEGKRYEIDWAPYITDPIDEDGKVVTYYEELFNVDFNVLNLDNQNIHEVLNLKFSSGEIPDYMSNGVEISNLPRLVDQGVLLGFDEEVIKEYMPNTYKKAIEVNPNWLNYAKIGDKIYGLPEMRTVADYRTTVVWRGDWLKNVGINKTPETLEEFEEAFYKFTTEDPDGNGKDDTYGLSLSGIPAIFGAFGYLPGYGPHDWQDWFWQERNGELVNGAVQPEVKEALKLLNKWYEDGVLNPEFITGENLGGYWALSHSFINGQIGYTGHAQYYHWNSPLTDNPSDKGAANYDELMKVNPEAAKSLVHGLPPEGPDGQRGLYAPNLIAGKIFAFGSPLAEEPDKFGKILEILDYTSGTSKENYLTAIMGIKGEMWEEPEPGVRLPTPEYEEAKGLGTGIFQSEFAIFNAEELRNEFALEHQYDVGAIRNELLTALPSEQQYKSELLKIRDEAYISIITGDQPIDYFDEFVEKWNNMGGNKLKEEANEWYQTVK